MGRIVIACYRPKAGKKEALKRLILDHVATLRSEGLVTERTPITMEAEDGTIVEVFEWVSSAAIRERPHQRRRAQDVGAIHRGLRLHPGLPGPRSRPDVLGVHPDSAGVRHTLPPGARKAAPPPAEAPRKPAAPPARTRRKTRA